MSDIRIKFNGPEERYSEVAITGQQQVWLRGQSSFVTGANASLLLATGKFTQPSSGEVGTAQDPITGLDVLDAGSRAVFVNSFGVSPTKFSMIGDSRTADLWSGGGKSSRNFFNWACAYYKQAPILVGNYGASGKRSDEYLTNGNFETALADGSGVLIFGYPAVNDIGTAFTGYTDAFGNVVTLANAASVIVGNLARYWRKAVDAGKKVVVLTEPGSTVQVASQVAVMHEINALIKKAALDVPGVILFDPCPIIWDPVGSATLLTKRTGYSGDGTHAQQMEARAVGKNFATNVLPLLLPKIDTAPAHLSDTVANGTRQLFRNPLFNTLSGGTTGSNITVTSGTVPAVVAVSGSVGGAGLAVVITSASNVDGFGKDVTFAFTATAAVTARIDLQATLADWNLTDTFESTLEVDIAAGSTATGVFFETGVLTDSATKTNSLYDLYSGASGPMSAEAETGVVYRTRRGGVSVNSSTKTAVQGRLSVVFGAGTTACTVTLRRPGITRHPE